ncbi:MAG: prefoldin subunit alpha [Candidatus Micrarchaeota archaeon]
MDNLEELYARLAYETRLYKNQLMLLQREIEKITLTTIDLGNATHTVESIHAGDAFVPIGGGSFVKGAVASDRVLLGVGGGYLMEVNKDVAVAKLKQRSSTTREAINRLTQEFTKISAKLDASNRQLREVERQVLINRKTEETAKQDYL